SGATALVTRSGLRLLVGDISTCLARGGFGEILIGIDLPTEPDAIQSLLKLCGKYSSRLTIKRFKSESTNIFHPKLWTFTLKSARRLALVGSSNFTGGGLRANFEANAVAFAPR